MASAVDFELQASYLLPSQHDRCIGNSRKIITGGCDQVKSTSTLHLGKRMEKPYILR